MPLVEQHEGARPDTCEVCHYLASRPELDRRYEHTVTRLAGWTLETDLRDAIGPLPMRSIYTEEFGGGAPSRSVRFESHHWLLALLSAPEIKLTIEESTG